jgi:hypothetical protein
VLPRVPVGRVVDLRLVHLVLDTPVDDVSVDAR